MEAWLRSGILLADIANSWVEMGKGFTQGISNAYLAYFKNYIVNYSCFHIPMHCLIISDI
jgi:hypothetical protein